MLYKGKRKTWPRRSLYGLDAAIILATGWTHDELLDQPADLLDELAIMIAKGASY